jgi:hypothetical protein
MDTSNREQAEREELVKRIMRAVRQDGGAQPLPGLHLYRASAPLQPVHSVLAPSFCVIAQGSKEAPNATYLAVCTTMLPPPIAWLEPLSYTSCSMSSASSHQMRMRQVSGEPSPAHSMNLKALPFASGPPLMAPLPLNWAFVPTLLTTSHS